ncbi:GNAT family N-acetyltransferase [Pseudogracilibacillus sp. SE30717A]|uniref:GNAT family N-acetyltransferase n=1 Tax=Pseudogracilibacillus sp. SE30717A TaxID=3098293 RepID=UPI00300E2ADC
MSYKKYEGQKITVYFDKEICQHAAECVKGLPEVFNVKARPWISPDQADEKKIAEVIHRCPSGALKYQLKSEGDTKIEIKQGSQSFYIGNEENSEAEVHFVRAGKNRIILDHTHVAEHLRGKNVGQQLVKAAVDYAKKEKLLVVPLCPFAKAEFDKHPEYQELLG